MFPCPPLLLLNLHGIESWKGLYMASCPKVRAELLIFSGCMGCTEPSRTPKKLALTELLFQAVLCEARALGNGQPIVITGGFNVQPVKKHCLAMCMEQGGWVDLEAAFASGQDYQPTSTCKVSWTSNGTRRDFLVASSLALISAVHCWIDQEKWIKTRLLCQSFSFCRKVRFLVYTGSYLHTG